MKILFAATSAIAVETLERLNELSLVSAVLTSPDERGKRGKELIAPPVKVKALELSLPVYQFDSLKKEARSALAPLGCDTLVSFSYGKIFGPKFLSLFERKYNIHPSALPEFRGCSPLFSTILSRKKESRVCIQNIALGVDEGEIINYKDYVLDGTETSESLEKKISSIASSLASETFSHINDYEEKEQIGEASYTYFIKKEDGRLDFERPAEELHARIRACWPWPKAFCLYGGETLIISGVYGSVFSLDEKCTEKPGTVVAFVKGKGLKVSTSDYYIYISRLQKPGKKEMDAQSFINGDKRIIGALLC